MLRNYSDHCCYLQAHRAEGELVVQIVTVGTLAIVSEFKLNSGYLIIMILEEAQEDK